jgi:hypothetical protein
VRWKRECGGLLYSILFIHLLLPFTTNLFLISTPSASFSVDGTMSLPDRDWTFTRILDVKLDEHQRCLYQVEWQDTVWKESVSSFNELTLDGALLSSMASSVRPIGKNQLRIAWAPTWLSADELAVDGGLAIHWFWSAKMYLHWSTKSWCVSNLLCATIY